MLEQPFADCSLLQAALFLRLAYEPEERAPANLDAVQSSLPGLLRLAHKLDAQPVFRAIHTYMAGTAVGSKLLNMQCCGCRALGSLFHPSPPSAEHTHAITTPLLLHWAGAADTCHLDALRLRCLTQVARRLAKGPSSLAGTFADAVQVVDACDKRMLAQLVGLIVWAGNSNNQLLRSLVTSDTAAAALLEAGNHGSFEWALERFSEQPAEQGQHVFSPWFMAAGREWRLQVHLGGFNADAAGHLSGAPGEPAKSRNPGASFSQPDATHCPALLPTCFFAVFLCCNKDGTKASFTIAVVDKGKGFPQHRESTISEPHVFSNG